MKNVSLAVREGEVVTIIGANGAGKTTTLMTICGIIKPTSGEIHYKGEPIHNLKPDQLPGRGLCQVPEGRRIFPRLTVQENLDMGAFFRSDREGIQARHGKGLQPLPRAQGKTQTTRRHTVRGRTANARHSPARSWDAPNCCSWMNHPWGPGAPDRGTHL